MKYKLKLLNIFFFYVTDNQQPDVNGPPQALLPQPPEKNKRGLSKLSDIYCFVIIKHLKFFIHQTVNSYHTFRY